MDLKILKNNILKWEIFIFLILPTLGTGLSIFLPGKLEYKIPIFVICIWLWSLSFPKLVDTLDGKAVDFWYYSLAIVGVLLFFFADAENRERIRLTGLFQITQENIERLKDNKRLFADISQHPDAIIGQIKEMAVQNSDPTGIVLEDCWNRQTAIDLENNLKMNQGRKLEDNLRLDQRPGDCSRLAKSLSEWNVLASVKDQAQFRKIIPNNVHANATISIGNKSVPLSIVAKYMAFESGSDRWIIEMKQMETEIGKAQALITKTVQDFNNLGALENTSILSSTFKKLKNELWPFILITALGMKLARQPYAYSQLTETK